MNVEALLEEFHAPAHIRRHCEKVAEICSFIGEKIPGVNLGLLEQAALLHDLVRVCDFRDWDPEKFPECTEIREKYEGQSHEEAAAGILASRGYDELANLVRSHRFANILEGLNGWEEKILYYADKRVEHDKVVSLIERLDRGKERNARTPEELRVSDEARPKILALEKELCDEAGIKPEDLLSLS